MPERFTDVSDLRHRWDVLDEDVQDDDRDSLRNRRLAGFVRGGLVAVIVVGVWIGVSVRQQADQEPDRPVTPPRAVIEAPAGFAPSALIDPDLSPADGSTGTWTLLAGPEALLFSDTWLVAACRQPGSREVGNATGIVTGTLGADLSVDATDSDGVRVVATGGGVVSSAMVLDRRPTSLVTVIAARWDGEVAELARELYDVAQADGCTAVAAAAADSAGVPIRQARALGAPVLPVGLRMLSADETTVAWSGAAAGATIALTSQRLGAGGDDADLLEFVRPTGGSEAEVVVGDAAAHRADYADGSELLVWLDGGMLHTLALGPETHADVVALANTLRTPTDAEWTALASSVTGR